VAVPVGTELTDEIVERFARKIQPMLVNNCTNAGCHQPGSGQSFQLDRGLLHGTANRRSTMANLTATLGLIDRNQPAKSALLTTPRRAHGGLNEAILGPNDDRLVEQLIDWVTLVTKPSGKESVANSPPNEAPIDRQVAIGGAGNGVVPVAYAEQPGRSEAYAKPRYGAELQPAWQPKDEFDPEIFNRHTRNGRAQ
jgi:hypothetical protein